ncbi:hypothetical protein OQA88_4839 [Cercophora sp. LCS_1]
MATVAVIGTCDTKLEELLFLRSKILEHPGLEVVLIDVGRTPVEHEAINIAQDELLADYDRSHAGPKPDRSTLSRGELMEYMGECAIATVEKLRPKIHSIVAAGGSGNTSLASRVMRRALPLGFPKLLVSTVASGDTAPYIGESDITMVYSVVDIAGLNYILRDVLGNAANMIAGAALGYAARREGRRTVDQSVRRIGITMFGVTTPAVDTIRRHLAERYPGRFETLVFHATGSGGNAMESLINSGRIDGVIDLTTTEVCDLVAGGNMSAGPNRLLPAVEMDIPCIVSLGATDMVNFGAKDTVPEQYKSRKLYEHNSAVTLMRVDKEEASKVAEHITGYLSLVEIYELVELWIPKGGVSIMSKEGGVFEDKQVDAVLFNGIKEGLKDSLVVVKEDERDINDEGFARDLADAFVKLMDKAEVPPWERPRKTQSPRPAPGLRMKRVAS